MVVNSDFCSKCVLVYRSAAVVQKYENGTSDRIIGPQRDEHGAERMQVSRQLVTVL